MKTVKSGKLTGAKIEKGDNLSYQEPFGSISAYFIPHYKQNYNTAGNYLYLGDKLVFYISTLEKREYEVALLVHEIAEALICNLRGIKEKDITKWDLEHIESDDPGSIKGAPYYKEHREATRVEMLICKILGIKWSEYSESFSKLKYVQKRKHSLE